MCIDGTFGVFVLMRHTVCLYGCDIRCVGMDATFGVFALVRHSTCLYWPTADA